MSLEKLVERRFPIVENLEPKPSHEELRRLYEEWCSDDDDLEEVVDGMRGPSQADKPKANLFMVLSNGSGNLPEGYRVEPCRNLTDDKIEGFMVYYEGVCLGFVGSDDEFEKKVD